MSTHDKHISGALLKLPQVVQEQILEPCDSPAKTLAALSAKNWQSKIGCRSSKWCSIPWHVRR